MNPDSTSVVALTEQVPPSDVRPWHSTQRGTLLTVSVATVLLLGLAILARGRNATLRTSLRLMRIFAFVWVLFVCAVWASDTQQRRNYRKAWARPLHVAVVLLELRPLPREVTDMFLRRAKVASELLHREHLRYRPASQRPFWIHTFGPVPAPGKPPVTPEGEGLSDRIAHKLALTSYRRAADEQAQLRPEHYDVCIYVVAQQPDSKRGPRFVEGVAEAEGEVGLVEVDLDESMVDIAWTAVMHELLHTVGAKDHYDGEGHALIPEGLAEPLKVPLYPQRLADIMVGEVPLGPGRGRIPDRLSELSVGPATALEIGWKRRVKK